MSLPNAITCDLEDYYQVENAAALVPRDRWDRMPSRLAGSTERVLALLEEAGVRATFFVLGWNAEREGELVRRVAAAGHEIASHGYAHRMIAEQSPAQFRDDVRRAKALLEDLSGRAVWGYRAPTFSVTERTRWALEVLGEEGYRYDSSVFPIRHDRYGLPSAPRFLHRVGDGAGLVEFPPTTVRLLGCNLPVAGGGYLRLLPVRLVVAALRRVHRGGHAAMVYFHPWEVDPEQPRLGLRGLRRFRHYVNLGRTAEKLRHILRRLPFTTARAVVEAWLAAGREPAPDDPQEAEEA
ncbi:MAG: XrtA system polysaccharide deacetylase [Candidatus Brocadiia bacterium]